MKRSDEVVINSDMITFFFWKSRKVIISELLTTSSLHFITIIMVDLIAYEEQESKYLIAINLRIIVHRL